MKPRNSSLDLLKIIAIIMVIMLHYFNPNFGGGLVNEKTFLGLSTHTIEAFCIVAVNIFILITGFYSSKRNSISVRKVTDLLLTTLFYGITIFLLFVAVTKPEVNIGLLKHAFIMTFGRWFIILYVILYLLIPYINYIINHISKKQFQTLLYILLIFFSILPVFLTKVALADSGYNIVHFIHIYLIGAYIHTYQNDIKKHKNKLIAFGLMSFFATIIYSYTSERAWDYCSPFVIMSSIALFLIFKDIKIKEHKHITKISSFSLAIYLIHANHLICKWLYKELFFGKNYINTWLYIPNMLLSTVGIFVTCCAIEHIRRVIFKKTVDKVIDKISLFNKNIAIE